MFNANVSQTVVAFVQSMLPRGNLDQAMYVPLELRLGNTEVGTQSTNLALFIWRPKAYTLVAARFGSLTIRRQHREEFILKSYWRHDGVESTIAEAYRQLVGKLKLTCRPIKATAKFIERGDLGIHLVDTVEYNSSDYSQPVVVYWRQGG